MTLVTVSLSVSPINRRQSLPIPMLSCNPGEKGSESQELTFPKYVEGLTPGGSGSPHHFRFSFQGCPTLWRLWATLEEEELSWDTH